MKGIQQLDIQIVSESFFVVLNIPLFIFIIVVLGYIVTFTKVLTICHSCILNANINRSKTGYK
jgi:hypothetical protein